MPCRILAGYKTGFGGTLVKKLGDVVEPDHCCKQIEMSWFAFFRNVRVLLIFSLLFAVGFKLSTGVLVVARFSPVWRASRCATDEFSAVCMAFPPVALCPAFGRRNRDCKVYQAAS